MANRTKLTAIPQGPVPVNTGLKLTAEFVGQLVPAEWKWAKRDAGSDDFGPVDEGSADLTVSTAVPGKTVYRATPVDANGGALASGADLATITVEVTVGDAADSADQHLVFSTGFAVILGIALALALVLFVALSGLFNLQANFTDKAAEADPRAILAAKVIGPILLLGAALIAVGIWMAAVEWRGTFKSATTLTNTPKGFLDAALLVLKDLKGSSLLIVGGIAVIFAVAWMVSSTVSTENPSGSSPTSSPTDTPSGEPATPAPTQTP